MRRVLFDENLPRKLRNHLPGLQVQTVAEAGWAGVRNGELLRRAASVFDAFLTADRNLPFQQNVRGLPIGIVVLAAGSTKLPDLAPLASEIQAALTAVEPGNVLWVPAS